MSKARACHHCCHCREAAGRRGRPLLWGRPVVGVCAGDLTQLQAQLNAFTSYYNPRHAGRLYHIGVGRTHAGTHVLLIIQDLRIRIVDAATGQLLRDLTLDPATNYQPTGRPPRPTPGTSPSSRKRTNPEP